MIEVLKEEKKAIVERFKVTQKELDIIQDDYFYIRIIGRSKTEDKILIEVVTIL